MTKLLFVDNRKSIVDKVKELGIKAIHGDYFIESAKVARHVLCTASNRSFTFGGGIDRQFLESFPFYCELKQTRQGMNERIGNICFVISVDGSLNSNKGLVKEALQFAIKNTAKDETLCFSALGTGIGLLSESDFVEVLKELI